MAKYKLNDIAPIQQGDVPKADEYWLLNLDMVESNTGKVIDYVYCDESEIGNSTVRFDTRNVLYSKLRPYLNKVVIPKKAGYATSEMLPMRPNPEIVTREYLTYYLRSPSFVSYINEKTSGAKDSTIILNRKFVHNHYRLCANKLVKANHADIRGFLFGYNAHPNKQEFNVQNQASQVSFHLAMASHPFLADQILFHS